VHNGHAETLHIIHRNANGVVAERVVSRDGVGREIIREGDQVRVILPDRRVVLVGIRRAYPAADISAVRESLLRDREACLSTFYAQCFFPARPTAYRRFRAGLQAAYLREMDGGALHEGLSYLEGARLSGETLPACPVAIVHGGKDVVAPFAEAERLAREGGNATFHPLPGAAHAAFLADGFRAVAADG